MERSFSKLPTNRSSKTEKYRCHVEQSETSGYFNSLRILVPLRNRLKISQLNLTLKVVEAAGFFAALRMTFKRAAIYMVQSER